MIHLYQLEIKVRGNATEEEIEDLSPDGTLSQISEALDEIDWRGLILQKLGEVDLADRAEDIQASSF
jgi:hypothetical protein